MNKENKKAINIENGKKYRKKITKRIIIILAVIIIAFIVISLLPFLYFAGVILYNVFIDIPSKPKVNHGEFPFELVYEYKGEQNKIKDTIVCDYEGYSFSLEGGNSRDWNCKFKNDDNYGQYYVDPENEPSLFIQVPEAADYYMGDKEYTKDLSDPYIRYNDEETGTYYEQKDKIDVVDIKIIEWKPSEPLKNNIK